MAKPTFIEALRYAIETKEFVASSWTICDHNDDHLINESEFRLIRSISDGQPTPLA